MAGTTPPPPHPPPDAPAHATPAPGNHTHQTTPPRPHPPARRTHYEPDPDRPPSPTSAPPSPQTNPSTKDRTHTGHHHMRHPHSTLTADGAGIVPGASPTGCERVGGGLSSCAHALRLRGCTTIAENGPGPGAEMLSTTKPPSRR
ncbi:hypothetical protein HMPREF9062_0111 [Actinomyces sp. oral taxon 448 str. F0400]|nr:hypothetical protein HMPREF9062_0111 [Actinomyces sp. oral taxon 448 str. F0400]